MWVHSIWDRKVLIPPGVMENSQGRTKSCWAQHRGAAQLNCGLLDFCGLSPHVIPLFFQVMSADWSLLQLDKDAPSCWDQATELCLLQVLSTAVVRAALPGAMQLLDSLLTYSTSPQVFGKFASSFQLLGSADNRSLQEQDSFIQSSLKTGKDRLQRQENGTQCRWEGEKGVHSD